MRHNTCNFIFLALSAFVLSILPESQLFSQTFKPTDESFKQYPVSRMVPRCQVRNLGALGSAGSTTSGRLVCQKNVRIRYCLIVKRKFQQERQVRNIYTIWSIMVIHPNLVTRILSRCGKRNAGTRNN